MMSLLRKPAEIDEHAQRQKLERGMAAERLAREEAFTDALQAVSKAYMDAWRASDPFDVDVRERAWIATKLIDDIKAQIINTVREGAVAQKLLDKTLRQ